MNPMEYSKHILGTSIIILAYNEELNIEKVFSELFTVVTRLGQDYEIIIVNDGSTDRTGDIADKLAKSTKNIFVIHHKTNLGLGGGYKTGFSKARGNLITFFPADGQFPASIIEQFFPLMANADMLLGYIPNRNSSLLAKSLSKVEKLIYGLLFGPLPEFQGIIMFKRKILNEIQLKSTGRGWAILMELVIRTQRGGYRITSVPTEMRPRISGKSKVNNLRTIWANLKQVLILRSHL